MEKTLVIATVQSGGLTQSGPGAMAESWAFNAFVRRASRRMAVLSFLSRGGLKRAGDTGRLPRVSTGSPRAKQRLPRGFVGVWMGRTVLLGRGLGFFESFPFLWIEGRL